MTSLESIFSVVIVFLIWWIYLEKTMFGPHRWEEHLAWKKCTEYEEWLNTRKKLALQGEAVMPAGPAPARWHSYLKKKYS